MQNKTIIKKLRDDKHYYGEFGKQYISNSDIKVMRNDPEQFHAPSKTTVAMEQGKYFHQLMLEPTKSKDFPISDATRRDAKHKAFLEEKGLDEALKTNEAQEIESLVKWFKDENNPKSKNTLRISTVYTPLLRSLWWVKLWATILKPRRILLILKRGTL